MRKHLKYASLLVAVGTIGLSQVAKAEDKEGGSFWDNTKVTGSLDVNYNYNFNRPTTASTAAPATNGYRLFDANANNFNVSLFELAIQNDPTDWFGLRADLDFGRDAATIHSPGLGGAEFVDLQQAYATLKADIGNGLTFKVGKFVTMHGAEVIESAYNYNASRSFLFNYAIPFTHVGIMASYPFADWLNFDFAIVNGWNAAVDNNNGKSFHTMFTIKPFEKLTWYLGGTFGPEANGVDGQWRTLLDTTLSYAATDALTLALNYDLGRDGALAAGTGSRGISDWQGIAAYAHWKPVEKFALSLRGEFYKDDVATLGAPTGSTASTKIGEGTLTTHYYIADGLDLRFEFRHDQGNQASFLKGNGTSKKYQDTIASQLVYSF